MAKKWYIRRGGEVRGPFPTEALARYRVLGRVREHDEVSSDKQHWQRAGDVAEINPDKPENIAADGEMSREEARAHLKATAKFVKRRQIHVEDEEGEYERRFRQQVPLWMRAGQYLLVLLLVAVIGALPFIIPEGEGVDAANCKAAPAPGVNWRDCLLMDTDFANSDLVGANLRSTNLSRAVLRAANLSRADAAYANLSQASLRAVNLSEANLNGANLVGADLTLANLRGADLSYADLRQSDLRGADMTGARLDNAVWAQGVFCMPGSLGSCQKARR